MYLSDYNYDEALINLKKEYQLYLHYVGGGNSLIQSTAPSGGEYGPDVMLTGLLWE